MKRPSLRCIPTEIACRKARIFHAAGASAGMDDRRGPRLQGAEAFRNGASLMPRLQQGITGGFTTPPQESTFDVHNPLK